MSAFVNVTVTGFECQDCDFDADERGAFDQAGIAMTCPECASTRVEHQFTTVDATATGEVPR